MSASSSGNDRKKAAGILRFLATRYGEIPWWPGDTDEVMIGAILTQQTRWENVERALDRLRQKNLDTLFAIQEADPGDIESAIRCTGFFRVKTKRLRALAAFVRDRGGIPQLKDLPTPVLREGLIGVPGIGEETADSILCYGFGRASFVVDAYTERIARCAGVTTPRPGLKALFESVLPKENKAYRQAHAHIVEYAKEECTKKRCDGCRILALNG